VLRKHGDYGPLTNLFPAEAEAWAKEAGVNAGDCLAFRLERPGLRAEVVLAQVGPDRRAGRSFKIVRVNNVKQLAEPAPTSTTE
jgi:hypothetical protein